MATFYPTGGGGSAAFSSECTAKAEHVLQGVTAITSESLDEAITGTLNKTAVRVENSGLLSINSTLAF